MKLLTTWPLLIVELFLLVVILFAVLAHVFKREEDYRLKTAAFLAASIALGTIVIEAFFVERAGWLTLIPAMGVTVVILSKFSWTSMWSALLIVLAFAVTHVYVSTQLIEPRPGADDEAAEKERKTTDVTRYQQVAEEMAFAPELPDEPPPPPPEPAEKTAASVAPAAVVPVSVPVVTNLPPPEPDPPDWTRAGELIELTGTMMLDGKRVANIGGRMLAPGDTISVTHEDKRYRWLINDITPDGLDLERAGVSDIDEDR